MNDLSTIPAGQQTMSSREIADLCEKRHDNVMADIRKMIVDLEGEGGLLKFQDTHRNPQNGQSYPIFRLPKRETLILVSGYRLDLRAKIIDRWQELEEQARQSAIDPVKALNDPATMRGLLLGYSEKVLALEAANAELAPKAHALDRIADTEGTWSPTDAAKMLGCRPGTLINWLRGPGRWLYRRAGNAFDTVYQDKLQKGLVIYRHALIRRSDGTEQFIARPHITAKGLSVLAETFHEPDTRRTYAPNRIAELRKEAGLSQKQLAAAMDVFVTKGTISKLETGRMALSLDYIRSIAKALGVEPADLTG